MNYEGYFKRYEESPEYQKTEEELRVLLDLADDILRLRMEKGWSQADFAERAETKQANISRIESGLSNPSIRFLQKLAKALGATLSIRFESTQQPSISTSTSAENQSIHVPNWPQAEIYNSSYERSSSK